MRRTLTWAVAIGAVAALAATATAVAKWDVFRAGNVIFKFDGGAVPKALPKKEFAPLGVYGKLQVGTADGSHPPAFRGGTFEVDRNAAIDARGVPVCKAGQLEARDSKAARRVCGKAIVGSGRGTVEIAFPEQRPIPVKTPLTFFNGGVKGNTTTLFVHAFITVPVPAAIVTTVKVSKIHKGRYGLHIVTDVPVIAGGSGATVDASFKIKRLFTHKGARRSYLMGRCPDGRFLFRIVTTDFQLAGVGRGSGPGISGSLSRPCRPKGR
jgi:hypothetical protein